MIVQINLSNKKKVLAFHDDGEVELISRTNAEKIIKEKGFRIANSNMTGTIYSIDGQVR